MNWLAAAVGAMTDESAERQNILSLGALRSELSALPADALVLVNGKAPTSLASYRGYYERLAIGTREYTRELTTELIDGGPEMFGYQAGASCVEIGSPTTVAEFIRALDLADGEVFEGYKGGQYEMHNGTWMHVADYGDTGLAVYGVHLDDNGTACITAGEYNW